ncbi:MAG: patatin-like phospholipase family protein [bacterium]
MSLSNGHLAIKSFGELRLWWKTRAALGALVGVLMGTLCLHALAFAAVPGDSLVSETVSPEIQQEQGASAGDTLQATAAPSTLLSVQGAATELELPESFSWDAYIAGEIDLDSLRLREAHVPAGFLPVLEHIRPRVGLALSGGGARGIAHIGVIQVFEEEGIPVDMIAGTSMGAILGGLYAAGYSGRELQTVAEQMDWGGLFSDTPSRRNLFLAQKEQVSQEMVKIRFRNGRPYVPDALVSGQNLYLEIQRRVSNAPYAPAGGSFSGMRSKLTVIATDLNRGEGVRMDEGDLTLSLRATMALPIVFRALRFRGMLLVDGGAIENIPVRAVLDMGADVVIGVDCASPVIPNLDPDLPWEIANQVTTLMSAPNDTVSRNLADLVLTPDLAEQTSTEFRNIRGIIEKGREAARQNLDRIIALTCRGNGAPSLHVSLEGVELVTDAPMSERINPEQFGLRAGEYTTKQINGRLLAILRDLHLHGYSASSLTAQITPDHFLRIEISLGLLHAIRVEGVPREQAPFALREVSVRVGEPLTEPALRKSLIQLFATGRYTTVFRLIERDSTGGVNLTFLLEPAPLPRLGLGLGFDTDRRSRYFGEFAFASPLPSMGNEILFRARYGEKDEKYGMYLRTDRLATTYLGWRGSMEYISREQTVYNFTGNAKTVGDVYTTRGQLDAIFNLRTWGGLSAGLLAERVADDIGGDDQNNVYNGFELRATLDTEDRKPFPSHGAHVDVGYTTYIPKIGEKGFNLFSILGEIVGPIGPRWVGRAAYVAGIADLTTPETHRFAIGGLTSFPAAPPYRWLGLRHIGGTAEVRYDLISRVIAETYLLARYDVAAFSDQKDWRPQRDDLIQSFALGIALDTFLGPFELWGAYMPPSRSAPEAKRVMVNLGYRF